MNKLKGIDDLVNKLSASMPESVKHLQADVEQNLKSGLESGLQKMNLVTREEFDTQSAVLMRTRTKLEELEKKVSELEAMLAKN
jgi:BMFP domain-containing protein YqiC